MLSHSRVYRLIKRALISIVLSYLTVLAVLWFYQKDVIFLPRADGTITPLNYAVPFEELRIQSTSHLKLKAWWIPQPNVLQAPTLLYCHGNGATLSQLAHVTAIFYEFGWNALIFDYRNYGGSDFSPAGLSEVAVAEDAQAAYDWVRSKNIAPDQIIIWGHSLGSSVAALLASKNKSAALVLEGAFSSLREMSRVKYPWIYVPGFLIEDKFDTLSYVQNVSAPTLVMHAEKDSVIPPQQGRLVFEAVPGPKMWLALSGIDHNDFPAVYKIYKERILDFVGKALRVGK